MSMDKVRASSGGVTQGDVLNLGLEIAPEPSHNEGQGHDGGGQGHLVRHLHTSPDEVLPLPSDLPESELRWWGVRNTLGVLFFLGLMVAFLERVALSITVVAMVTTNVTNTANASNTCPLPDDYDDDDGFVTEGEFDWDVPTQSILLGSFFYGYTATNLIGGRAAEYLGGRLTFGLGILIPSILTLLSPICVRTSISLFIALRILQGLMQAMIYPSMHLMLAGWIPPKEKSLYCCFMLSGANIGTVLGMSVGGWLSNTSFLGGWPAVYYVFGGVGVVWGVVWFLLAHDLPETHPRIEDAELQYILKHRDYVKRDEVLSIPWRHIFTSGPFWAIVVASFCDNFNFYTLLTEMPTYFSSILHYDIGSSGLMSALPYIVQCAFSAIWGLIVDFLQARNYLSIETVRKLSTSVALYLSAAWLLVMMLVGCDPVLAVVVMCLSVGVTGSINSGAQVLEQDIAPNFAGTLKGLTNTVGSATGFLAPAVTGAVIDKNPNIRGWNTVFSISAALNLVFCTIFLIFGTNKVQDWNYPKAKGEKKTIQESNKE